MKRIGLILGGVCLGLMFSLFLYHTLADSPPGVFSHLQPSWPGVRNEPRDELRRKGSAVVPGLVSAMNHRALVESPGWSNFVARLPDPLAQMLPQKQSHARRRFSAVWMLGEMGPMASNAVPELDSLRLTTVEEDVRIQAILALVKIQPDNPVTRAGLFALLKSKHQPPRFFAAQEIGAIRHPDPELVAALVGALNDPDDGVRANATWSVAQFGAAGRAAAPRLRELLKDTHSRVSMAAAYALVRVAPDCSPEAVATMTEFWQRRTPFVDFVATPFALELGPSATNAVPWLENCLAQPSVGLSSEVAMVSLWRIRRQATPAMLAVLPLLSSPAAIEALGELGPLALVAEPRLQELRDHASTPQREAAKVALSQIKAESPGR